MATDVEIRNRIVATARDLFFAHGFTKVTMDEIASLLGMSKKTVYEYFPSKDKLVDVVIERHIMSAMRMYADIMNSPTHYVDKLYNVLCLVGRSFMHIGTRFQDDMHKLRPDLWHYMEGISRLTLFSRLLKFIEAGVEGGYVRGDIQPNMFLFVYLSTLQSVMSPHSLFRAFSSAGDEFRSLTKLLLDGMLTESGRNEFHSSDSYQQLTQRVTI